MSYNMVDARSKEPLAMEDLTEEDVVSNISPFEPRSQGYSSTTQGSEMSHTQAYSVNFRRKSAHQLPGSQDEEPIIPNSSNKEASNGKSAIKPVVTNETRARWAMLRALVGVSNAEDETEADGNSGVGQHDIESNLSSGEAGYQASDNNVSRNESELHRPQVPTITVVPGDQSISTEMVTASRNLLADSTPSATNDAARIERYSQNVSQETPMDIRGLNAGLQGEIFELAEKDVKALAGSVESVLRADAQGVERVVHLEKETIENMVHQSRVQGIERALQTEGERTKDAARAFGKTAGKVLEEEAHEVKKAFEKEKGLLMRAERLERAICAEGQEISNDIKDSGRNAGKALEKDAREIKRSIEKEVSSLIGAQAPQLHPQGTNHASQPLRSSSPSAASKINIPHQQKKLGSLGPLGLLPGHEESQHQKQRGPVHPPRPRTPSAEPQALAHPQRHMNPPNPTRSPLPSQNSQVQNPHLRNHTQGPGSFRPFPGPQQANNMHILPPQPSQKLAPPPQRGQFPSPSAHGTITQPANNSEHPPTRTPLPRQGPGPRNQQVPFSTISPAGGPTVQPTNSDNPPPHRPLLLLPGSGSRLQQHLSPIPSTHGPIIQPPNKGPLSPSPAPSPLPVQLPKPVNGQLPASQTSLGPPPSRLPTTEIHPTASQTPQAGPPGHGPVVPSRAPIRRVPQPFGNQSSDLLNNSLQPSRPELPSQRSTGNTHASGSLTTNPVSRQSSYPQSSIEEDPSMNRVSQSNRRHQSPSNASLKSLDSHQLDSSARSVSTESITPQSIPSTGPSLTTAQHPLAGALGQMVTGLKHRSEASIAACNGHPGFVDRK
jgi:hypothetical protein